MGNQNDKISEQNKIAEGLWLELRNGNKEAFTELYNYFHRDLFYYGYKILQDTAIVEDCIQDIFVDFWAKRKKLPVISSVKFFFLSSLKKKLLMAIRSETNRKHREHKINAPLGYDFYFDVSFEMQIIEDEENREIIYKIQHALNQLNPREKEVIYLRFYSKMPYEEIAQLMSISVKSAHNLLHKSMKSLRALFNYEVILVFLLSLGFGMNC